MNLLEMKGAWGGMHGALYEAVVARGCEPLYRRFADEAVATLDDGARVLDLGCGGGHLTRILAERFPRCSVTGVDLSAAQVQRAQARYGSLPNLAFRQGDAQSLPLDDQSVDVVASVASIKHWPDQTAGLREVHRVLATGGVLCILETSRDASPDACRGFVAHWRYVVPGTRWVLSRYFRRVVAGQGLGLRELEDLLREAGFDAVESLQIAGQPFVAARATKTR